jgi:hypothetical protein
MIQKMKVYPFAGLSMYRRNTHCFIFVLGLFMLISLSCTQAAGWIPEFSLDPFGSGYFGKYSGTRERYNLDGGIAIGFDLLKWENAAFYLEYITLLEMAEQVGNVSLDPRYTHTFIIEGFRIRKCSMVIKPYFVHDCRHLIDMEPDSNKVVFNRLKLSVSQRLEGFRYRFQIDNPTRSRKLRWEVVYGFYPQSKLIDYLNSRPYYHHEFQIRLEYPLLFYRNGELFAGAQGRYVMSAHDPRKYYRDVTFLIECVLFKKNGAFSLYLEHYAIAEDPVKAPDGLSLIALRYTF